MSFDLLAARNRLGIVGGNQDAEIIVALNTAIAIVERYLDRKLPYTQEIAKFYNVAAKSLKIDRWPIYSVVSIKGADGVELTGYKVHHTNGLVEFASVVFTEEVQVEYIGGFPEYPPDLLLALWSVFDVVWSRLSSSGAVDDTGSIQSITVPDVGTIKMAPTTGTTTGGGVVGGAIPVFAVGLLESYRNFST